MNQITWNVKRFFLFRFLPKPQEGNFALRYFKYWTNQFLIKKSPVLITSIDKNSGVVHVIYAKTGVKSKFKLKYFMDNFLPVSKKKVSIILNEEYNEV